MNERSRWILHIKELRVAHDVSIFEAEKIALADLAWQRWVGRQIATDERCRRMALRHIRDHGDAALIGHDGTRLFVR
ncbi:hypothetical protein [Sphingomonas sp. Leaf10]|uniref:hypothetical protein n=1 Tax=Sphingomonas sp. Leaf10 TaxID=1735676 RepID=UPI0006F9EEE6|nr:hypothetical protein [Sphingomonas sp. Leaf10]KQM38703.1 hypothetical protein ASE59_11465 [Sphingomonas sp. Leaf10]